MGGEFRRLRSWIGIVSAVALSICGCGSETPPLNVSAGESEPATSSPERPAASSEGASSPNTASYGPSTNYGPPAAYGPSAPSNGNSRYSASGQATATPSRYSSGDTASATSAPSPGAKYPSMAKKQVRVKITTSLGPISIGLFPDKAPLTVDNFLRNYVDTQFYDNTIVHYTDSGIVAAGGYSDRYQEKGAAARPIRNEANNGLKNVRGTIAMGRAFDQIDSATSQFFFNVTDNDDFDHAGSTAEKYGYCVFGKVLEGMDIVDRMAAAATHDAHGLTSVPKQAIVIESIEVLR